MQIKGVCGPKVQIPVTSIQLKSPHFGDNKSYAVDAGVVGGDDMEYDVLLGNEFCEQFPNLLNLGLDTIATDTTVTDIIKDRDVSDSAPVQTRSQTKACRDPNKLQTSRRTVFHRTA